MFPRAFRSGWTAWWILSVIILIISGILWPGLQIDKDTLNNQDAIDDINNLEEVIIEEEVIVEEEVIIEEEVIENSLTIDELIDLGFNEKYSKNFQKAAYYFFSALALGPTPDLAFYLIIDCYWLLNNLEERDYALTELKVYIQKYLSQFNPELRHRFDAWIAKENLCELVNYKN